MPVSPYQVQAGPLLARSRHVVGRITAGQQRLGDQAGVLPDLRLDFGRAFRVVLEVLLGVLAPLADPLGTVRKPGTGLFADSRLDAEIEQLAGLGDALTVHDVELDHLERRRQLVLDHLHARLVADHLVAILDRADPADFQPHRRVELERVAAGRGLRIAEHHADLHPNLIDEDDHGARSRDRAGELTQGLTHQPRLQADMAVAHLAFQFGARHERRHGIHHQHVDGTGTDQRIGDFQRLFPGIGLRDQQIVDVDAELAGVNRIERMLGVDERANSALLLRLGDRVQRERRLAGTFRAIDFNDAAARQTAYAERDIEADRAGGDRLGLDRLPLAEPHDRAFAEGSLDLTDRRVDRPGLVRAVLVDHLNSAHQHRVLPVIPW